MALGSKTKANAVVSPVSTFFTLFGSVALSRLECLLFNYTSCLQALDVTNAISDRIIIKDNDKPRRAKTSPVRRCRCSARRLRRFVAAGL
jgi:hypothetical protein